MSVAAPRGEIVTFYSYKGGTGRSMLLANVAWILASNGARVLVLDWDLEAPGLHRYFHPFLVDKELTSSDGIIDFVIDFSMAALDAPDDPQGDGEPWYVPYANVLRYAASLDWDFGGGTIDFVGAGRQGASYSTRVNSFDWQDFYDRFGGGALLEEMKGIVKERYQYVLVDSRTGVSDTAGICTLQLPDTLVVCFTLNNQSIEGAAAVSESVRDQRGDDDPIRILPVPMRVENSEKERLELRKSHARRRFAGFPSGATARELDAYWSDVEVLYVPFYAYEEILATFGDRPGDRHSILASAERLAARLTDDQIARSVRPSEASRARVLAAYEGSTPPPPVTADEPRRRQGVYISYRREDTAGVAGRLYDGLAERLGPGRVWLDVDALTPGLDVVEELQRTVGSAAVVLALIGNDWLGAPDGRKRRPIDDDEDFVRRELAIALARDARVIPVLVDGARMPAADELPDELAALVRRQSVALLTTSWARDVDQLLSTVELVLAADRASLTVDGSDTPAPAYGEERLSSLLEAEGRLRRLRWIAIGVGVVAVVGVLSLVYLLSAGGY